MIGNVDKNFARMLVGAFNESIEKEYGPQNDVANTKPLVDYGRELMEMPKQSGMALTWYGFVLGFMQGCRFMAEARDNPEAVKALFD